MRLVCPNCDAEYEVDTSAIPDTGRDVQCSNCGHAWFQMSPRIEEELAAEEALFEPPPAMDDGLISADPATLTGAKPGFTRPPIEESVLAVLREEAERETNARRAEAPRLETQDELDLTAAMAAPIAAASPDLVQPPEPDPVAERIARMKGIEAPPAKPQSRREMLPEIDEINTTLRASSEPRTGDAGVITDSLPGAHGAAAFRTGFVLMILLALAIVALYVMAPNLAQQIPAAKGALDGYVVMVDSARLWLDAQLRSATGMMGGTAP